MIRHFSWQFHFLTLTCYVVAYLVELEKKINNEDKFWSIYIFWGKITWKHFKKIKFFHLRVFLCLQCQAPISILTELHPQLCSERPRHHTLILQWLILEDLDIFVLLGTFSLYIYSSILNETCLTLRIELIKSLAYYLTH